MNRNYKLYYEKKNSFHNILTIFLIGLALFSFEACSNGSSDSSGAVKSVYFSTSAISDYTRQSLQQFAYVKSDGSSTPDIYIITDTTYSSLTDSQKELLVQTILDGKTVLIDGPTKKLTNLVLMLKLQVSLKSILKEQYETRPLGFKNLLADLSEKEDDEQLLAIAVRGSQIYYVHDITATTNEWSGSASEDEDVNTEDYVFADGQTEIPADAVEEEEPEINPADYVKTSTDYTEVKASSIAKFAKWLSGSADYSRSLERSAIESVDASQAARNALEDAANEAQKAQTFIHNFTVTFTNDYRKHYDGRYEGRSENVEVITDVWTACELEKATEYYLIRNSVVCNNQDLKWKDDWDNGYYKSPYFDYCETGIKVPDANPRTNDCSPQNKAGSKTFETGITKSLSGSLGLSKDGPSAGLDGGLTWSKSSTTTIPDITVEFKPNATKNSTGWYHYATEKVSGSVDGWGKMHCSNPKSIQKTAAVFDTYSIFERPSDVNDTSEAIKVTCYTDVGLTMYTAWKKSKKKLGITYAYKFNGKRLKSHGWEKYKNSVKKPCNVTGEYAMDFKMPEEDATKRATLEAVVKEYVSDWTKMQKYYAVGKGNLDKVAKTHFASAMSTIENYKDILKRRGFSGKYKFYLYSKDSSEITSKEIEF